MDHQVASPIQPIHSEMSSHSRLYAHRDDEYDAKAELASSSSRSPTTIFAVDELSGVFRVPDDAIERAAAQEKEAGIRRRCLTPSITTDGELSTFSEDTEEDEEVACTAIPRRFPVRRRRSQLSIFRPSTSGTKRRSHDMDDEERPSTPTKRPCSAPPLCHANPIGASDDGCDEIPPIAASHSFASPFKRVCRSQEASSPYTSFFSEARPATTISNGNAGNTVSLMPNHLQHPLSIMRASAIVDEEEDTKKY